MKKITLILISTAMIMACESNNQQQEESVETASSTVTKWKVNTATHEGMTNIKNLLDGDFVLDSIGFQMAEHTTYIINKCDMKGEEHDQLHTVLHPMLENIDILKNSTENEEKETALSNMKELINKYFENFTN